MQLLRILVVAMALWSAACGDDDEAQPPVLHPDVLAVAVEPVDGRTFEVSATLSSPYDTPDRYADGWRVLDESGAVLGVRELLHDHAGEQPFTRSLTVDIPPEVTTITVEGRDQVSGWGGAAQTVEVPRAGAD